MDDFEARPNTDNEDLSLPKATMAKLIQEYLPESLTAAKETRDLLTDACVEFIHLISSEANEICEKETKKTIAGDHVIKALQNLGFEEYVQDMQDLLKEHQKTVKQDREKKNSKKDTGMTDEEMIKLQEEIFQKARDRLQSGTTQ